MVVEGNYRLSDFLDYEDGVTPEEFFLLYRECATVVTKSRKQQVENFIVALGSIFDNKVLKKFYRAMDEVVERLERSTRSKPGRETPAERQERMKGIVQELNKLSAIM